MENPFKTSSSEKPAEQASARGTERTDVETRERAREQVLIEILENHARKINEGKNGVILQVNTDLLPERSRQAFLENAPEGDGDSVLKVFKLNNTAPNQEEFEMQRHAEELLKNKLDDPTYAQVPKAWALEELSLTPSAQARLQSYGATPSKEGKASVLIMDHIPGDDLATALYREVVKRHPKTVHLADHVKEMDFGELSDVVTRALDMRVPGGKGDNDSERAFEDAKVQAENSNKLFGYLERSSFKLNPAIAEQLANTIKLFHESGFYLRDAHHRNVMVVGEIDAAKAGSEPPKTFLIDFGTAAVIPKGEDPYYDRISGNALMSDDFVGNTLKRLLGGSGSEQSDRLHEELRKLSQRMSRSKPHQDFKELLKREPMDEKTDIWRLYQRSPGGSAKLDAFLAMLEDAASESSLDSAAIARRLEMSLPNFTLPEQARIKTFISSL